MKATEFNIMDVSQPVVNGGPSPNIVPNDLVSILTKSSKSSSFEVRETNVGN